MQPIHFAEANKVYKAPADWDEEKNGPCADLPTLEHDGTISSIWKPTPEELAILVAGGGVVLTVSAQYQPPVRLWAIKIEPMTAEESAAAPVLADQPEVTEVEEEVSEIVEESPHPEVRDFPNETGPLSAEEEHDTIPEVAAKNQSRLH